MLTPASHALVRSTLNRGGREHGTRAQCSRANEQRMPHTWSLIVCTYRREAILPRCIRCALRSGHRPKQVIVVDASPDWRTTRDAILGEFAGAHGDVAFLYVE